MVQYIPGNVLVLVEGEPLESWWWSRASELERLMSTNVLQRQQVARKELQFSVGFVWLGKIMGQ
jgi:hypothetical protein